jgi:hypothetical protein
MNMVLKSSACFAVSLLFLHIVVAISVCATAIPVSAKITALMLLSSSLVYYFARDVFRQLPNSWAAISLDRDGMLFTTRDGRKFSAQPEKNTFVHPYLIVLRIVPEGCRKAVSRVIFPDALDEGAFRELSVRLRFP